MSRLPKLTPQEVAQAVVGCEIMPRSCEIGNGYYRVMMSSGLTGSKTNLEQTVQLLKLGMTKNEIQDMTGCGDLVDLVEN